MNQERIILLEKVAARAAAQRNLRDLFAVQEILKDITDPEDLNAAIELIADQGEGDPNLQRIIVNAYLMAAATHVVAKNYRASDRDIFLPLRKATEHWQRRGLQPDIKTFNALADDAKQYAFAVKGISSIDVLRRMQAQIQTALAEGIPAEQAIKQARAALPQLNKLSLAHTRLIYRNAVLGSAAAGLWHEITQWQKQKPYLVYEGILDNRIRPHHRALHGLVLHVTHPLWNEIYPPNGHNCRCTVRQLSADDLKEEKLSPATPAHLTRLAPQAKVDAGWLGHSGRHWAAHGAQSALLRYAKLPPDTARKLYATRIAQYAPAMQAEWDAFLGLQATVYNRPLAVGAQRRYLPPLPLPIARQTKIAIPSVSTKQLRDWIAATIKNQHGIPAAQATATQLNAAAQSFSALPAALATAPAKTAGAWRWQLPAGKLALTTKGEWIFTATTKKANQ